VGSARDREKGRVGENEIKKRENESERQGH